MGAGGVGWTGGREGEGRRGRAWRRWVVCTRSRQRGSRGQRVSAPSIDSGLGGPGPLTGLHLHLHLTPPPASSHILQHPNTPCPPPLPPSTCQAMGLEDCLHVVWPKAKVWLNSEREGEK